jgi:hypothetical protein
VQTASVSPAANIDPSTPIDFCPKFPLSLMLAWSRSAKLGLLPKRPVSLLQPVPPPARKDSEDEDLEYVENPFEDGPGERK